MPRIIWRAGWRATTRTRRTSSRRPTCGPSSFSAGSGAGAAVPGCCASFATPFTIGSSAIATRETETSSTQNSMAVPTKKGPRDELLLEKADYEVLHKAIAELPVEFREILVLRELEGFSYKEIAEVANMPLGTVMSRLARAREHLRTLVIQRLEVK